MRSVPHIFVAEKYAANETQYEQVDPDTIGYIRGCLAILINVFGKLHPEHLTQFDQKVSEGFNNKDLSYYKYLISRQITEIGDNFRELEAYFKAT